jgi:pimeloyl-ACP methyl ester carboxylesterase
MPEQQLALDSTLTTSDGILLHSAWCRTISPARAAVVVAHGFTSGKDHPDIQRLAGALTDEGYDVLTYDARGHGESGGECTLGEAEVHDVAAAVAAARLTHEHVVTVGASMGAIAALGHATTDPRLQGTVLVSCPAQWRLHSLRSALGAALTRTPPGRKLLARMMSTRVGRRLTLPVAPEIAIAAVPRPIAVLHGLDDRFIPPSQGRRLASRAPKMSYARLIPGMGHAFDAASVHAVIDALDWIMAAAPPVVAPLS